MTTRSSTRVNPFCSSTFTPSLWPLEPIDCSAISPYILILAFVHLKRCLLYIIYQYTVNKNATGIRLSQDPTAAAHKIKATNIRFVSLTQLPIYSKAPTPDDSRFTATLRFATIYSTQPAACSQSSAKATKSTIFTTPSRLRSPACSLALVSQSSACSAKST